eukprot:gene12776-15622_t
MTVHQNLIDGAWIGGDAIANINPSNTNDVVGEYARATAEDTLNAIAAAKAAFPAWSRSGILERHAILRKTADEITARKDEIGRLLSREEGKTLAEGIGETVRAAQIFDFFAGEVLRLAGEVLPSARPNIGVEGVLNLVMGKGSVVGQTILDSADVNAITFTGSVGTGKRVAAASIEHMRIHDRFVAAATERLKGVVVDDALKAGTHVGPVVDQSQLKQDEDYIAIGKTEGARLAFGGERLTRDNPGFYLQPALFTEATNQMRISREEIFGPVASVIRVKDYEEALHTANDTPFGLSSGIATTSLKHATHFKRNAEAGMVMVNLPTAGVDFHVPFGGRKGSSYGPREQGKYAAEFYTTVKTAYTLA